MKQFLAFTRKEFLQTFRDKRTMFILIAMPIVMVLLFGFAVTTEVKDSNVAVLDLSKDSVTKQIQERIEANKYFTISQTLNSYDDIDKVFKQGKINVVLVFGEHFADNMLHTGQAKVQILTDGTEPNQAAIRTNYMQAVFASYLTEISHEKMQAKYSITPVVKMLYNPQQKSEYNFVPGVIGMMLLLICAMMSSIAIVREKELGTMEILLASPLPPIYIILSKAIPYFVISCMDLTIILLLAAFVLNVPIAGSLFWLIMLCLLYIFLALALGLLISTVANSQLVAMLMSGMILMLPTMLLSGLVFNIESMPKWLQVLSMIVPARWFIDALRRLMIQGVEVFYVVNDFAILLGMALLCIVVALEKFKIRLE